MNSLRDTIAYNSGVKSRQQLLREDFNASKKEVMVMKRVLDIISNFVTQVEDLRFELNAPNTNPGPMMGPGVYGNRDNQPISQEEMSQIKKKAYELFMSKMKLIDEAVHCTFGVKHEDKEERASEEEDDADEEW